MALRTLCAHPPSHLFQHRWHFQAEARGVLPPDLQAGNGARGASSSSAPLHSARAPLSGSEASRSWRSFSLRALRRHRQVLEMPQLPRPTQRTPTRLSPFGRQTCLAPYTLHFFSLCCRVSASPPLTLASPWRLPPAERRNSTDKPMTNRNDRGAALDIRLSYYAKDRVSSHYFHAFAVDAHQAGNSVSSYLAKENGMGCPALPPPGRWRPR